MTNPVLGLLLAVGCLLVMIGVTRFVIGWRRTQYTFPQYLLFRGTRILVLWQWRAKLPEKLTFDMSKGAVIICNHRSSIDPFFIQVLLDRPGAVDGGARVCRALGLPLVSPHLSGDSGESFGDRHGGDQTCAPSGLEGATCRNAPRRSDQHDG